MFLFAYCLLNCLVISLLAHPVVNNKEASSQSASLSGQADYPDLTKGLSDADVHATLQDLSLEDLRSLDNLLNDHINQKEHENQASLRRHGNQASKSFRAVDSALEDGCRDEEDFGDPKQKNCPKRPSMSTTKRCSKKPAPGHSPKPTRPMGKPVTDCAPKTTIGCMDDDFGGETKNPKDKTKSKGQKPKEDIECETNDFQCLARKQLNNRDKNIFQEQELEADARSKYAQGRELAAIKKMGGQANPSTYKEVEPLDKAFNFDFLKVSRPKPNLEPSKLSENKASYNEAPLAKIEKDHHSSFGGEHQSRGKQANVKQEPQANLKQTPQNHWQQDNWANVGQDSWDNVGQDLSNYQPHFDQKQYDNFDLGKQVNLQPQAQEQYAKFAPDNQYNFQQDNQASLQANLQPGQDQYAKFTQDNQYNFQQDNRASLLQDNQANLQPGQEQYAKFTQDNQYNFQQDNQASLQEDNQASLQQDNQANLQDNLQPSQKQYAKFELDNQYNFQQDNQASLQQDNQAYSLQQNQLANLENQDTFGHENRANLELGNQDSFEQHHQSSQLQQSDMNWEQGLRQDNLGQRLEMEHQVNLKQENRAINPHVGHLNREQLADLNWDQGLRQDNLGQSLEMEHQVNLKHENSAINPHGGHSNREQLAELNYQQGDQPWLPNQPLTNLENFKKMEFEPVAELAPLEPYDEGQQFFRKRNAELKKPRASMKEKSQIIAKIDEPQPVNADLRKQEAHFDGDSFIANSARNPSRYLSPMENDFMQRASERRLSEDRSLSESLDLDRLIGERESSVFGESYFESDKRGKRENRESDDAPENSRETYLKKLMDSFPRDPAGEAFATLRDWLFVHARIKRC